MNYETLLYSLDNNTLTITLNRPDVYNACNERMMLELQEALKAAAEDDRARCVVVVGAGDKAFCSGQDLREPLAGANGKIDFTAAIHRRYNPVVRALRDMPKPVLCGINGVAAGAGLSLALACDIRIMAASARLVEGFTGIALIPDAGGTFAFTKMLGYAKAFEFVALNEPLGAEDALKLGLVNRVAADEEFTTALQALAARIAAQPTKTLGLAKRLLRKAVTATLDEMLELEAEYQQQAGDSQDFQIGVQSFVLKQEPAFVGR